MEDELKPAIECFPVGQEVADDLDELRDTFPYKPDLRAALESYFHIYDDFAEFTPEEFEQYFKDFTKGM